MTRTRRNLIVYVVYGLIIIALIVVALVVWAPYINESLGPQVARLRPPPEPAPKSFLDGSPEIYGPVWRIDGYDVFKWEYGSRSGGSCLKIKQHPTRPGVVKREDLLRDIARDLEANGWRQDVRDPEQVAVKRFYGAHPVYLADDDLCYMHDPLPDEPLDMRHACRIFVSKDAKEIVAFCDMGL